jgi:DNA replication protein DnaC
MGGERGVFDTLRIHEKTYSDIIKMFEAGEDNEEGWLKETLERGEKSIEKINRKEAERIAGLIPFHIIGAYSNMTTHDFENNKLEDIDREKRPYMAKALDKVQSWTPEVKKGFFLYGEVGSGKSRLLRGFCLKWARNHKTCQFWPVHDLIRKFKEFDMGTAHQKAFRRQLTHCDILVIDDFGAENTTDFVQGELLSIIDERCNRAGSLHVTSNIGPTEIADQYGIRIFDRMRMMTRSMKLIDGSYRGQVKKDDFWDK